jgi:hypothetical protein
MRRAIGWLTAAIIITLIFGSTYAALQQLGRRSANAAPAAAAAAQVQLIGSETLTVRRLELTPDSGVFVIVYGADDRPVSGTVTLHGSLPGPPCRRAPGRPRLGLRRRDVAAGAWAADGGRCAVGGG